MTINLGRTRRHANKDGAVDRAAEALKTRDQRKRARAKDDFATGTEADIEFKRLTAMRVERDAAIEARELHMKQRDAELSRWQARFAEAVIDGDRMRLVLHDLAFAAPTVGDEHRNAKGWLSPEAWGAYVSRVQKMASGAIRRPGVLSQAILETEKASPLPRCQHGNALADGAGESLTPTCGCSGNCSHSWDGHPASDGAIQCRKCGLRQA